MTAIIVLIVIGIVLIIVDLVFIPGAILAIVGGILCLIGIMKGYSEFGFDTGSLIMGITFFAFAIIIILCFRFNVWARFALKDKIDAVVNEGLLSDLKVGQIGKAISALRPSGTAEIENKIYEVTTLGHYSNQGISIKIIKIENNKIFVEPLN